MRSPERPSHPTSIVPEPPSQAQAKKSPPSVLAAQQSYSCFKFLCMCATNSAPGRPCAYSEVKCFCGILSHGRSPFPKAHNK